MNWIFLWLPTERLWFDQYQRFLEHYVQLAKTSHADLFCVGGELAHLTPYDSEWRKLIARVRQLYPGPLVYAANFGEEFEHVAFWDDLDYIGLQEYYPLPDNLAVDSIVQKVETVQQKYHRPVIFTEVGFPSLAGANRQPWDDSQSTRISLQAQAAGLPSHFPGLLQSTMVPRYVLVEDRNQWKRRPTRQFAHAMGQARDGGHEALVHCGRKIVCHSERSEESRSAPSGPELKVTY